MKEQNKKLIQAVKEEDVYGVEKALDDGADINMLHEGKTPLCIASYWRKKEVALLLLRRGASLELHFFDELLLCLRIGNKRNKWV